VTSGSVMFVERRRKWSFFILPAGWVWRVLYPNGTEACSDRAFRTLEECQTDATQHGYVIWDPARERRRPPV
jgi:hypothetical protein